MPYLNKSRHVLLICSDALGENMAGPGIRHWEFARVLSQYFTVTLAIPPFIQQERLLTPPFEADIVQCKSASELYVLAKRADVIITLGIVIFVYPTLLNFNKPLVLDIYVPTLLENVQIHSGMTVPLHEKLFFNEKQRNFINTQLRAADFMICASEKQRDYWLGLLSALGRINPYTYDNDKTLRCLIDVVPFGLPKEKPVQTQPVLKGIYKTIQPDDQVLLWTGGIWDWLDAPTLIKAMPHVVSQQPKVKLFFMGVKRPLLPVTLSAQEAIELSKENGLYESHIFFNDWVPYEERQNYLLEADLGVSLHLNHIETRFSFRTRFLDHLWTGLPLLATEGDILSAELVQLGLGRTVAVGDVMGVAQAILEMLPDLSWQERYKVNRDKIISRYQWETVIQPLLQFCANPYFAPDKAYLRHSPLIEVGTTRYWQLPQKAWQAYRSNGLSGFWWQLNRYIVWKLKALRS
jgi:glycosyltransferase involved in cell wall biosynthesis